MNLVRGGKLLILVVVVLDGFWFLFQTTLSQASSSATVSTSFVANVFKQSIGSKNKFYATFVFRAINPRGCAMAGKKGRVEFYGYDGYKRCIVLGRKIADLYNSRPKYIYSKIVYRNKKVKGRWLKAYYFSSLAS
jgi:hypothetical protein